MPQEYVGPPIVSVSSPLIMDYNSLDSLPPLTPTSNLTEALAQYVGRTLMAANPDGPQDDGSGQISLASPNADDLAAAMAKVPVIKNFKAPDWDSEVSSLTLATAENAGKDGVEKYAGSINEILGKYFLQSDIASIFYQDPATADTSKLANAQNSVKDAFDETKSVTIPATLADFHKSLLKILVYEKNAIALGVNAADDPLKASLIIKAKSNAYDLALLDFQSKLQKTGLRDIFSSRTPKSNGFIAFMNNLLGVKTAYAQWNQDFLNWATQVFDWLEDKIGKVLTQVIKNLIINTMQRDIMNWAKSGFRGAPAFITNWKGFLENTALTAVGAVIADKGPRVCGGFRPLIQLAVKNPPYIGGVGSGITGGPNLACSLNIISSIRGFYHNFAVGGWRAYGTVFQIQNNYFGGLIDYHDSLLRQTAKAQAAANSNAVAAKGFKNKVICDSGYTQISEDGECSKQMGGGGGEEGCASYVGDEYACLDAGCEYDTATDVCGGPTDMQPGRIATPGDLNGSLVVDTGASGAGHLVVNAENLIGLLTVVAQSLVTRVISGVF